MSDHLRTFDKPQFSFVIFASPKSGTTWLQRLLSFHPSVLCAESRAFGDYYHPNPFSNPHLTVEKYISILSNYYAPAVTGLKNADTAFYKNLLFNVLDTFATTSLRATGKTIYGEKLTPYRGTASNAIKVMHEYNPEMKFVNLVRDGRDVIVSGASQWLNLRLRRASPEEKETYEKALSQRMILDEDFKMFQDLWSEAAEAGLVAKALFNNYLHVTYEQFVADPIIEATRLLQFLGADASPAQVSACVESNSFKQLSGGRERGEEDLNNFFRKGVAGDWKQWFTPEQERVFAEQSGSLLTKLGYA